MKIIILILALTMADCNNGNIEDKSKNISSKAEVVIKKDIGYELTKQYCYVCHMPKSKESMIAPPLFRVKEHYKPSYPVKEDFIKAIVNWVQNPIEDKVMMPGAVRKFNLMPSQAHIPKDTLKLIAAYIFENEIERPRFHNGSMNRNRKRFGDNPITLDNGAKWKVGNKVFVTIDKLQKMVDSFEAGSSRDYQEFGKKIFESSKVILLDKENKGETWEQLHNYFNKLEGDMHSLIGVKSVDEAELFLRRINKKLSSFNDYFEKS